MKDYSEQHKKAWEYDAYDFWVRHEGTPKERAREDVADPRKMLRKYAQYFDQFAGVKIANICGSCGKKAIPLALLGADVTVFAMRWRQHRPQKSSFIMKSVMSWRSIFRNTHKPLMWFLWRAESSITSMILMNS